MKEKQRYHEKRYAVGTMHYRMNKGNKGDRGNTITTVSNKGDKHTEFINDRAPSAHNHAANPATKQSKEVTKERKCINLPQHCWHHSSEFYAFPHEKPLQPISRNMVC